MKKSKRFFSFVGVALCAVMLLGSVGTLGSKTHVAEAETSTTINKTYNISELIKANSVGSYLEYGEYPQNEIADRNLRKAVYEEIYGLKNVDKDNTELPYSSYATTKGGINGLIEDRIHAKSDKFSYDPVTGYFTVTAENGIAGLKKGDKFYEYVSGVDTLSKYPMYAYTNVNTTTGTSPAVHKGDQLIFQDVRTRAEAHTFQTITAGTYYGSRKDGKVETPYTRCECDQCGVKNGNQYDGKCLTGTIMYLSDEETWTNINGVSSKDAWLGSNQYATITDSKKNTYLKMEDYVYNLTQWTYGKFEGTFDIKDGVIQDKKNYGEHAETAQNSRIWVQEMVNNYIKKMNATPYKIEVSYSEESIQFWETERDITYTVKLWALNVDESQINKTVCFNCFTNHNNGNSHKVEHTETKIITGQQVESSSNGYDYRKTYYFKVEPIKWKIEEVNGDNLILRSDIVLDSINFNLYPLSGNIYGESYLRSWLNYGSDADKLYVNLPTIDKDKAVNGVITEVDIKNGTPDKFAKNVSEVSSPIAEINTTEYRLDAINNEYSKDSVDGKIDKFNNYENGFMDDFWRVIRNDYSYKSENLTYYNTTSLNYMPHNIDLANNGGNVSLPSFVQMAFSVNERNALVEMVEKSIGTKEDLTNNVDPIQLHNYVTIPYDYNTVVYKQSSNNYIDWNLANTSCSDYAKATGFTGDVWIQQGGSKLNGLHLKNVATIDSSDHSKDTSISAQVNQTAGVVPVITLSLTNLRNLGVSSVESDAPIEQVDENKTKPDSVTLTPQDTVQTMISAGVSSTNGTTFKLVYNSGIVPGEDLYVDHYEVDRTGDRYYINLLFSGEKAFTDKVEHLKIIVSSAETNKTPSDDITYFENGSWHYNTIDYDYFIVPKSHLIYQANGAYSGYYYAHLDLDKAIGIGLLGDPNEVKNININVMALVRGEDGYLQEYYSSNSANLRGDTLQIFTQDNYNDIANTFDVTRTTQISLYEGEIGKITCEEISTGIYEKFYQGVKIKDGNGNEYTLTNGEHEGIPLTSLKGYDLSDFESSIILGGSSEQVVVKYVQTAANVYGWVRCTSDGKGGWVYNTDNDLTDNDLINSTLYSNKITQTYNVKITETGTDTNLVNAVMFLEYTDKVQEQQTIDFTTAIGTGGYGDLNVANLYDTPFEFKIYINNPYVDCFKSVNDLIMKDRFKVKVHALLDDNILVTDSNAAANSMEKTWTSNNGAKVTIEGPFDIDFENNEGVPYQKYYTITVSDIEAGSVEGEYPDELEIHKNRIAVEIIINHDGFKPQDLQVQSYDMTLTSIKAHITSASQTVTTSEMQSSLTEEDRVQGLEIKYETYEDGKKVIKTPTQKQEGNYINGISRDSEVNVDIRLKDGYGLLNNQNIPQLSFTYASQVLDNKGYRLAKSGTYQATNKDGKYYTTSDYKDKRLRLDSEGHVVYFDDEENLRYYRQTEANTSEALRNYQGIYISEAVNGKEVSALSRRIIAPILILDINEKLPAGDTEYLTGELMFIPKLVFTESQGGQQVENEKLIAYGTTEGEYLTSDQYKSFVESKVDEYGNITDDSIKVVYTLADFDDDSEKDYVKQALSLEKGQVACGTNREDIEEDPKWESLAEKQVKALGFGSIEEYYMTMFNWKNIPDIGDVEDPDERVNEYVNAYINSLKNKDYQDSDYANFDKIAPVGGDEWQLQNGDEIFGDEYGSFYKILMNRSTSNVEQKTTKIGPYNTYKLKAVYSSFVYQTGYTEFNGIYMFQDKYGFTLTTAQKNTGFDDVGTDEFYYVGSDPFSLKTISPVDKANISRAEPWTIMTTSNPVKTEGSQFGDANGYKALELSSGSKHDSMWYNESRQWVLIGLNDETSQVYQMSLTSDGTPFFDMKTVGGSKVYGLKLKDPTTGEFGVYEMYEVNGAFQFYEPAIEVSGNYFASYIRPVGATLCSVTENGKLAPVNGKLFGGDTHYSTGDTVFKVTINNVVSSIKFTVKDDTVSEHQYPIQFYSTFGGNLKPNDDGNNKPLHSVTTNNYIDDKGGGFIPNIGGSEFLSNITNTVVTDGDILKFNPYIVGSNYYFTAPIYDVAQPGANDYKITSDDGGQTYKINGSLLIPQTGGFYQVNGEDKKYYFTSEILEFAGWTLATYTHAQKSHDDGDTTHRIYHWNQYSVEGDASMEMMSNDANAKLYYQEINQDTHVTEYNYPIIESAGDLAKVRISFKNNSVVVALQAVYKPVELKVKFTYWNMSTPDKDGFKTSTNVADVTFGTKLSASDTTVTNVDTEISNYKFAEKTADKYATDKGWYKKLVDGTSFIEAQLLSGAKLNTNTEGFEDITSLTENFLSKYTLYKLWDNQEYYKYTISEDEEFYFNIIQDGKYYKAEVYQKFTLGKDNVTNNIHLYRVYETGMASVDFATTGDPQNPVSVFGTSLSISSANTTYVGQDIKVTITASESYTQMIGNETNIKKFLANLNLVAYTRYDLGSENHKIEHTKINNYESDLDFKNKFGGSEESGWTYLLASKGGDEIAKIVIKDGVITLTIKGLIGNATIGIADSTLVAENKYQITFLNPAVVKDGQGTSVPYGTFYLMNSDGTSVVELKFDDTIEGEKTFVSKDTVTIDGKDQELETTVTLIVEYDDVNNNIIVYFEHGTTIYIKFVRNAAFSQFIDQQQSTTCPFTVGGEIFSKTNKFYITDPSKYLWRVGESTEISYYRIQDVNDSYTLEWNENLVINSFEAPASTNQYTVTMYGYDVVKVEGQDDKKELNPNAITEAKYNQDILLEFNVEDAYTQFVPVLNTTINEKGYYILYPHMYTLDPTDSIHRTVYYNSSYTALITKSAKGYYSYPADGLHYRIDLNAIATGLYSDYYEVKVATSNGDDADWTTIGYIGYNEVEYVYKFIQLNIVSAPATQDKPARYIIPAKANSYNYSKFDTSRVNWTSDKNSYSITIGEDVTKNSAYKIEYSVNGEDYDALPSLTHGDQVALTITMNNGYTQTIPHLVVKVGAKDYYIATDIPERAQNLAFDINSASTYHHDNNKTWTRTNEFALNDMTFNIVQTYALDETFYLIDDDKKTFVINNYYLDLMKQAGLYNDSETDGYNNNENRLYISAKYVITFNVTDSLIFADGDYNGTYDADGDYHTNGSITTSTYNTNKYIVAFNKKVDEEDKGTITYTATSTTGNYVVGQRYYYFQQLTTEIKTVDHVEVAVGTAINPLATTSATGPDGQTEINLSTFESQASSGFTCDIGEGNYDIFEYKVSENSYDDYNFEDGITSHFILYAPYTEETYLTKIIVNPTRAGGTTNYGSVSYGKNYDSISQLESGNALLDDGKQIKYSDTTFAVKFDMNEAYNKSSIRFEISKYGKLLLPGDKDNNGNDVKVSTEEFINEYQTTKGSFVVKQDLTNTYGYYDSNNDRIAQVLVKDNKPYALIISKEIDAGENSTGTIDINIHFYISSVNEEVNTDTASSDYGKNKYKVVFIKPLFDVKQVDIELSDGYVPSKAYPSSITVKEYRGWSSYPNSEDGLYASRYTVVYVTHGTTLTPSTDLTGFSADKVAGYKFKGWSNKESTFEILPNASATINQAHILYGVYQEIQNVGVEITNDQFESAVANWYAGKYGAEEVLFESKEFVVAPSTNSTYSSVIEAKFTLNPIFSQNSNLTFASTNCSIIGVEYISSQGVYIVKLSYFITNADDAPNNPKVFVTQGGLATDSIQLTSFTIEFKNYTYSVDITSDTYTETLVASPEYFVTAEGNKDRVDNIGHNKKLTDFDSWKEHFEQEINYTEAPEGLKFEGWMYIRYYDNNKIGLTGLAEGSYTNTFYNIIKATLNGCFKGKSVVQIDEYEVGRFTKNTSITGNMFVLPYYTRQIVKLTFVQTDEGYPLSGDSLIYNANKSVSVNVPYGLLVMNDEYIGSSIVDSIYEAYSTVANLDFNAENNSSEYYEFDGYYVGGTQIEGGLRNYIAKETITISINFTKKWYKVAIFKEQGDTNSIDNALTILNVKYLSIINQYTELNPHVNGCSDLESLIYLNSSNYSSENFIDGWYISGELHSENLLVDGDIINTIDGNGYIKIYPSIGYESYLFDIQARNNFNENSDVRITENGDNVPKIDSETGYIKSSYDSYLTITFTPTEGYMAKPMLTIFVNGEQVDCGTTDDISVFTVTFEINEMTGRYSVKLSNFTKYNKIENGNLIEIIVDQSIDNYDPIIDASDIVVEYLGRDSEVYSFEEAGRLKTSGYNKVTAQKVERILNFEYDTVSYGSTFVLKIRVDVKYTSTLANSLNDLGTYFKFTITDTVRTEEYILAKAYASFDEKYQQDIFTYQFENVKGQITIDINEEESRIVRSQYQINYKYLFGGEANPFVYNSNEPGTSVIMQLKDDNSSYEPYPGSGTILLQPSPSGNYSDNYSVYNNKWYVLKDEYKNTNFEEGAINSSNIETYYEEFNVNTHYYTGDVNAYAFYIVNTVDVTPSVTETSKGSFELPTNGKGEFVADFKNEGNEFAKGYTFSYVLTESYSKSIPVISITGDSGNIDFIILSANQINNITEVIKKNGVTYSITKLTDTSYKYSVLALSGEGSTYEVEIDNGVYTIHQNGAEVATATLDGLKTTITLNSISDDFAIDVNDDTFSINLYSVEFIKSDGSKEVFEITYAGKLSEIPTEETNFIQKVVYNVTFEDGTTKKLSGKELAKLEITEDLVIEISVELNLVILIPLVVGAVVVVVVIVVVIVKGAGNSRYKRSSGSSNMAAFDKLNQNRPTSDASKKSDKPYNPYIDNSKDKN